MSGALLQAPREDILAAEAADRALRSASRKVGLSAVAGPKVCREG